MSKNKCQNVESVEIRITPKQENGKINSNNNIIENFNEKIVESANEDNTYEKVLEKPNEFNVKNKHNIENTNDKIQESDKDKIVESKTDKILESEKDKILESKNDRIVESENSDLFCFKQKRKNVKWTEEEEKILREGVRRFGKGNWTKILAEYKDDFDKQRRYRDLSDKIRNIEHAGTRTIRSRIDFWEVDQNDEPVCNKMGEPIIYFCKVPFEAASKCAYSKNYTSGDHIIKICYEEADQKWYHVYNARFIKSAKKCIQVRKIAGQSIHRTDGM